MEELEEKFISDIARQKKITLPKAAALIERCIKLVSTRLNVPYADVYASIHNVGYLSQCKRHLAKEKNFDAG